MGRMRGLVLAVVVGVLVGAPAAALAEPLGPFAYGPGAEEVVYVLPAPSPPAAATVEWVHGGYWVKQSTTLEGLWQMEQAQHEDDAMVVLVRYPQACAGATKEGCGVTETEAVERAFNWTRRHAGEFGGNGSAVALFGASAGGQLVERAANTIQREPSSGLASVTELSAPGLNFSTFVPSIETGETQKPGALPTVKYLDCGVRGSELPLCTPEREFSESPIFAIPAGSCVPQSISWGETNDLVSKQQSIEYAAALEAAGCSVARIPAPGGHAMQYWSQVKAALYRFWDAP